MSRGYFQHGGVTFPGLLYSPRGLEAAREFPVQDDDVFNVTYQKSGTVWMLEILSLIRQGGDPQWCRSVPNWDRGPWLETLLGYRRARGNPRPRIISSHLPVHMFPKAFFTSKAKVIYTVRDPKDVLVSLFHFARIFRPYKDPGSLEEFMEKFLQGDVPFGSWFQHVRGWLQLRDRENFFWISYEELQQDLRGSVQRLCSFLGRPLSPAAMDAVVANASFAAMSHNPMSNFSRSPAFILDRSGGPFLRKGISGDWRNHLSPEQSRRFDRVYRERMEGLGVTFPWDPPKTGEEPQKTQLGAPETNQDPPKTGETPQKTQLGAQNTNQDPPKMGETPQKNHQGAQNTNQESPKMGETPQKNHQGAQKTNQESPKMGETPQKISQGSPTTTRGSQKIDQDPPKEGETPQKNHQGAQKITQDPPKMGETPQKTQLGAPKTTQDPPKEEETPQKIHQGSPKTTQEPPKTAQDPPKEGETPQKNHQGAQKITQDPPKMGETPQKTQLGAPKTNQESPKTAQDPPEEGETPKKIHQGSPKTTQEPPKTAQDPPEEGETPQKIQQGSPKTTRGSQKFDQDPPEEAEIPQKTPQDPPKTLQGSLKIAQDPPKFTQDAPPCDPPSSEEPKTPPGPP